MRGYGVATIPRTGAPGRLGAWAPHSAAGGCGGLEVLECQIAHGRPDGRRFSAVLNGFHSRNRDPVAVSSTMSLAPAPIERTRKASIVPRHASSGVLGS